MKKAILFLTILICSVFNVVAQEQIEPEEYLIYKLYLEERFLTPSTTHIVIDKFTVSDVSTDTSKYIKRKLSSVKSDTLADYIFRNSQTYELKNNFGISQIVRLITEEDLVSVRRQERADLGEAYIKAFKEKFLTEYQISFSRVGFNKSKNQALVQIGYSYGTTGGQGNYIVLTKKNNRWIIKKRLLLWIS